MIHLVETLQTDAVILCDAIHAFAGLHHVRTLSVSLLSPALLLLQIDSLAWGESVALAALVVAGNLAGREPKLLAQRLEGVARLHLYIIILVICMNRMRHTALRLL